MAHIAKYKATSVGHMLAHYRRDASSLERDNIDPKRVKNDMVVAHYTNKDGKLVVGRVVPREGEPNWGTVERRIERVNEAQKAAGRLEVAIADLSRKLAPRSARMTTRALKRDLAALEKDMSPVTLASEARDAARASNARRGNVPQRDCGQSR